ncbi:hypothetical protein EDM00_07630 [Ornithobacterium rhinotracheale]|uniref:uracil-DNA glycosylase family protein n=1 Tax=Ornithobacterium rhinotracheale TaxID=28251 RepID=UPI00129C333B|nr:uracil-DNA glycosylase family protein [Ornithobacterium rhinotracheale]MRI63858.1 hypothetical protein [Ornithobacterium rhinotracheale]
MESIHNQIIEWADEFVPKFNELSKLYETPFYTQSSLKSINQHVDLMIIGINPKGDGNAVKQLSVDEFLGGNLFWDNRFNDKKLITWKFVQGTRFFLGYDDFYNPESIDNDERVVWTNLSPFESKGRKDLKKELMTEGLKSTLELIKILKPKRILLLGIDGFSHIEKIVGKNNKDLEYSTVFSNIKSQVGRINQIPTLCVPHPSGKWEVSNKFLPTFIFLHKLAEFNKEKNKIKPLKQVIKIMQDEMKMWQEKVIV